MDKLKTAKLNEILRRDYDHEQPYIPMSRDFSRQMGRELKKLFPDCEITMGNVYCSPSGYITRGNKHVYFSFGDFRYWNWTTNILIRTATSLNDYRGGPNHFCDLENLKVQVENLLSRR